MMVTWVRHSRRRGGPTNLPSMRCRRWPRHEPRRVGTEGAHFEARHNLAACGPDVRPAWVCWCLRGRLDVRPLVRTRGHSSDRCACSGSCRTRCSCCRIAGRWGRYSTRLTPSLGPRRRARNPPPWPAPAAPRASRMPQHEPFARQSNPCSPRLATFPLSTRSLYAAGRLAVSAARSAMLLGLPHRHRLHSRASKKDATTNAVSMP